MCTNLEHLAHLDEFVLKLVHRPEGGDAELGVRHLDDGLTRLVALLHILPREHLRKKTAS